MNLEVVAIQDCLDMYILNGYSTTINDGKVSGFKAEKIPTLTVNQIRDVGRNICMYIIYG